LIDDIRVREFLLAPLDNRVADLMDRRFVALKATDDQESAVAVFRQYDRTALPITDTAGMLIGIVTIDDILDVAETTATREIQRIGGSEALDEPYMRIAFGQMIRKRAGWLTALFLGEMLTATAMGSSRRRLLAPSCWRCSCRSSSRAAGTQALRRPRSSFVRWHWAKSRFAIGG
jgi:magnesium transporter